MNSKNTNRLISETSPYLLQHAHNPVDWYPWGTEALQKAKENEKVILVSIGYSACHWCHVMERESFENEATAAYMNEHFINIKIDREERPDLDHLYMDAVQAMSGSGGWPLNVFLTPEAKPFYGGTYFPPAKAFNRSSWNDVLEGVVKAWKERRHEMEMQAENLTSHLKKASQFTFEEKNTLHDFTVDDFMISDCEQIFSTIMKTADTTWGGFGNPPKFPQFPCIQFLFEYFHITGDKTALQQAIISIDKMLLGGIYDQVGGGLARYSTDAEWLAPHFEKMLYDNALLIQVLCDAYQITRANKYKLAIEKTIAFVINEMQDNEGGFYAALDADSEGEEGRFYVWQKHEIEKVLGDDAEVFCQFFDVSESGNWEGKNILRILTPHGEFAKNRGLGESVFNKYLGECLCKLKIERSKRTKPLLDDKVILGWNALMVQALAKAAAVLGNKNYSAIAIASFNFLLSGFASPDTSDNEMLHTWKNGVAKYPAFLDDYAYLASAALQLYQCTFDRSYLYTAKDICNYVISNFSDEAGKFFYFTNKKQDDLILRKIEIYDGATASGNAAMTHNIFILSVIFDIAEWRERSDNIMLLLVEAVKKYPGAFANWARLLLMQVDGLNEITIMGNKSAELAVSIQGGDYLPNKIIMASQFEDNGFPMLKNKYISEDTLIFLCKKYVCVAPFTSAGDFFQAQKLDNIK